MFIVLSFTPFLIFLGESTQVRQARGLALGVEEWGIGEIMHLQFNSEWLVIGLNSSKFKSHLGIIVKNGLKVPLTYAKRTHMPDDILEFIWKEVKVSTICISLLNIKKRLNIFFQNM